MDIPKWLKKEYLKPTWNRIINNQSWYSPKIEWDRIIKGIVINDPAEIGINNEFTTTGIDWAHAYTTGVATNTTNNTIYNMWTTPTLV